MYVITARGEFFNDAGWDSEEKVFEKVFKTEKEAEKVLNEIVDQELHGDAGFYKKYDDFYDPGMDKAVLEIVYIDPEALHKGGVFYDKGEVE